MRRLCRCRAATAPGRLRPGLPARPPPLSDEAVLLDRQVRQGMVAHSLACLPEEACGLLAVDSGDGIRMSYSLTNSQASAGAYTVEPREHFGALRHAEANGWELGGVFHSHPASAAYPSPTDVFLAGDPYWLYLIVGLAEPDEPEVRGFRIVGTSVTEVALKTPTPGG